MECLHVHAEWNDCDAFRLDSVLAFDFAFYLVGDCYYPLCRRPGHAEPLHNCTDCIVHLSLQSGSLPSSGAHSGVATVCCDYVSNRRVSTLNVNDFASVPSAHHGRGDPKARQPSDCRTSWDRKKAITH